ncbi:MAG: peptidoglycan DD-metalloendopeptidase family protein [Chloroflexi bacterium]|nr:peptidoglycan DD-metalloendopeptidase family protein [Chloroflexota bacterium]MXY00955.1 peptidoglycan DD-metalloendopeptidase family protein [Chloroflexota bacterium]MYC46849.1 peptidoglycan DD-metalloendopeptidase family protein [Chloroflexota bacterium]
MGAWRRFGDRNLSRLRLVFLVLALALLAACEQTTETAVTATTPSPTAAPEDPGFELARFHAETAALLNQGLRVVSTEDVSEDVTWTIVIESVPASDLVRMVFTAAGPRPAEVEIAGTPSRIYLRGQNAQEDVDWVSLPTSGDERDVFFDGAPGLSLLTAERLLKAWEEADETVSCGPGKSCYALTSDGEPGIELLVDEQSYRLVSYLETSADGEDTLQFDVELAADIDIQLPADDGTELDSDQFGTVFLTLLSAVTETNQETAPEPPEVEISPGSIEYRDLGRRLIAQFYAEQVDAVWGLMNEEAQEAFGSLENLIEARAATLGAFGQEELVFEEYVTKVGEFEIYERIVKMPNAAGPVSLRFAFDTQGRIAGFDIDYASGGQAAAENPNSDLTPSTRLSLPFEGQYLVQWGGRLPPQNRYAVDPRQQFGYDFVLVENGALHRGSGLANEDYFCFGKPVLAPAGGSIFVISDGQADNQPGQISHENEYGNFVVLSHGAGEFSFLTNLRQGSIAVVQGQVVEAGEKVGECGNSGASSIPHIHIHLQDAADPLYAFGIPARFSNYAVAGFGPVAIGEPTSGQTVGNR